MTADGAVLSQHFKSNQGLDSDNEFDFELVYHGKVVNFKDCFLISFADAWLILKIASTGKILAFNYLAQRQLEFSDPGLSFVGHIGGFFFERTRRKWTIYDAQGAAIGETAVQLDGDRPGNAAPPLRIEDTVYLSVGGDGGTAFLVPFCLKRGVFGPQVERASGYVVNPILIGETTFFIDRTGLFKISSGDLLLAEKIANFDTQRIFGQLIFWHSQDHLYIVSCGSKSIDSYRLNGQLISSFSLPSRWSFSGHDVNSLDGASLIFLGPANYYEWGYGALLSIPAGKNTSEEIFD